MTSSPRTARRGAPPPNPRGLWGAARTRAHAAPAPVDGAADAGTARSLRDDAGNDVVHEVHPEGQVVETHPLVVAVDPAGLRLVERKRRQPIAHDAELPEVMAVGKAGERRRGDEGIGGALARRGHDG